MADLIAQLKSRVREALMRHGAEKLPTEFFPSEIGHELKVDSADQTLLDSMPSRGGSTHKKGNSIIELDLNAEFYQPILKPALPVQAPGLIMLRSLPFEPLTGEISHGLKAEAAGLRTTVTIAHNLPGAAPEKASYPKAVLINGKLVKFRESFRKKHFSFARGRTVIPVPQHGDKNTVILGHITELKFLGEQEGIALFTANAVHQTLVYDGFHRQWHANLPKRKGRIYLEGAVLHNPEGYEINHYGRSERTS